MPISLKFEAIPILGISCPSYSSMDRKPIHSRNHIKVHHVYNSRSHVIHSPETSISHPLQTNPTDILPPNGEVTCIVVPRGSVSSLSDVMHAVDMNSVMLQNQTRLVQSVEKYKCNLLIMEGSLCSSSAYSAKILLAPLA